MLSINKFYWYYQRLTKKWTVVKVCEHDNDTDTCTIIGSNETCEKDILDAFGDFGREIYPPTPDHMSDINDKALEMAFHIVNENIAKKMNRTATHEEAALYFTDYCEQLEEKSE